MKKGIYATVLCVCLLLTAGCDPKNTEQTEMPKELISQIAQADCFLCAEHILQYNPEKGNIVILNLNTWDKVFILPNPQDSQQQSINFALEVGLKAPDGTAVETTAYPNRGYAYGKILGCQYQPEWEQIQSKLCQSCLDQISSTTRLDKAPAEYAVIDLVENKICLLTQNTSCFYTENYRISYAFETNGAISLLIHRIAM